MKIWFSFIAIIFTFLETSAQNETCISVELCNISKSQMSQLQKHGLYVENFVQHKPNCIYTEISQAEMEILSAFNIEFKQLKNKSTIFQKNAHINYLNQDIPCDLENFTFGSYGPVHSYKDLVDQLDLMRNKYPNLITTKEVIGTTHEDRAIYTVKISDNPAIDESDTEGVSYFDGMHHAREPMTMESLLYFMWWLLENYNKNAEATYIVNNRELYFVPIVNPDGYIFNEENFSYGQGYWRKNRRDLGNDIYGVDLNRNYIVNFANNIGSSDHPASQVYHGPEAFSEPETQAIRDLLLRIEPTTAMTCHAFGQIFITPPGCMCKIDNKGIYNEYTSDFIDTSFYAYGTEFSTLGYPACGTTLDYINSLGIYAWTPEIGQSFWPDSSEFCSTAQNMLNPLKYTALISGSYTRLTDVKFDSNKGLLPNEPFKIDFTIQNHGLNHVAENITIKSEPLTDNCFAINRKVSISQLEYGQQASGQLSYFVTPNASLLDTVAIKVSIIQNGFQSYTQTVKSVIGEQISIFSDYFNDISHWDTSSFELSEKNILNNNPSLVDSKTIAYSTLDTSSALLSKSINLNDLANPMLQFKCKWSFHIFDTAYLQISIDGYNWETLKTFERNSPWQQQLLNLSDYKNETVNIRFKLVCESYFRSDGIYIDDFEIADYKIQENLKPNISDDNSIKVFPNPATNNTFVLRKTDTDALIELFDLNGNLLKTDSFIGYYHEIDLSNIDAGMYIISINYSNKRVNKKLLVQDVKN